MPAAAAKKPLPPLLPLLPLLLLLAACTPGARAARPPPSPPSPPPSPPQLGQTLRFGCDTVVDGARIDPIVMPGQVAPHAHSVVGASGFGYASTGAGLQASACTSCALLPDKSNYWYPTLFYVGAGRPANYTPVVAATTLYYETRGGVYNHAFPPGFMMVAGNNTRRASVSQVDEAVSWICLAPGFDNSDDQRAGIPQDCAGDIRAQLHFPVCGNGSLYAAESAHTSYAYDAAGVIQFDGGACPPSHPIRYVSLFLEVEWAAGDLARYPLHADGSPRWVLSNGDTTGYGWHADFMNGWRAGALQKILDACDYGGEFGFFDPANCPIIAAGNFANGTAQARCRDEDPRVTAAEPGVAVTVDARSGEYVVTPRALPFLPNCWQPGPVYGPKAPGCTPLPV